MWIIYSIKFCYYLFFRYLLGKYSNFLVKTHVKFTPSRSTDDSFNEILLEQIRIRQRKIEQIRWNQRLKMIEYGKKIGAISDDYRI